MCMGCAGKKAAAAKTSMPKKAGATAWRGTSGTSRPSASAFGTPKVKLSFGRKR